jgi:hypothetical protein
LRERIRSIGDGARARVGDWDNGRIRSLRSPWHRIAWWRRTNCEPAKAGKEKIRAVFGADETEALYEN